MTARAAEKCELVWYLSIEGQSASTERQSQAAKKMGGDRNTGRGVRWSGLLVRMGARSKRHALRKSRR